MMTNHTELEICLCGRCANVFYSSSEYSITRSDPIQVIQDCCCYCCIRRGYDYRTRNRGDSAEIQISGFQKPSAHFCLISNRCIGKMNENVIHL